MKAIPTPVPFSSSFHCTPTPATVLQVARCARMTESSRGKPSFHLDWCLSGRYHRVVWSWRCLLKRVGRSIRHDNFMIMPPWERPPNDGSGGGGRVRDERYGEVRRLWGRLLVVARGRPLPTGHRIFPEAPSSPKVPRNRFLSIIGLKMLRGKLLPWNKILGVTLVICVTT